MKLQVFSRRSVSDAFLLVMLACATAAAEQAPNTLSEAERRAGWKLLFDGTSPDAFRNFRKEGLGAGWQVRDGSLVRAAKGSR